MANGGRRIEKNLQHLTLGVPKSLLGLGLGFRARVLFKIFFIQTKIAQLFGLCEVSLLYNTMQTQNLPIFDAVKCNLMELTTKSACVLLEVRGVNTYAHVSQFRKHSLAWRM